MPRVSTLSRPAAFPPAGKQGERGPALFETDLFAGLPGPGAASDAGPSSPLEPTPDLAALRRRLAALMRPSGAQPAGSAAVLPFGLPALDDALPGGGLPVAGLHR